MPTKESLIAEMKHESSMTKKILEKVPMDKKDWKPHEKSMTLGRLASHVAEITHWVSDILNRSEFDFMKDYKSNNADTNDDLMKIYQEKLDKALEDLSKVNEEDLKKHWVAKSGGQVYYDLPKGVALRGWAYNHLYHHRGQLSVYLRLLDIPVPGMYGPSADEK
jgi:uncharacterized damage-inducible protein DinB